MPDSAGMLSWVPLADLIPLVSGVLFVRRSLSSRGLHTIPNPRAQEGTDTEDEAGEHANDHNCKGEDIFVLGHCRINRIGHDAPNEKEPCDGSHTSAAPRK